MALPTRVDPNTVIPIGSAITITIALFKGWLWISAQTQRIDALELKMIEHATRPVTNRWTCTDHERFAYQLQVRNPKINVPENTKSCDE